MRALMKKVLIGCLAISVGSGIWLTLAGAKGDQDLRLQPLEQPAPQQGSKTVRVPLSRGDIQYSFAPLVKQTGPAVVNVYASQEMRRELSPFFNDPFFEQFFGGRQRENSRVQSSLGSGVIVEKSGVVVTNFHVIRGADKIKVALQDGREYESTVLLKDESVDLAVLKINTDEDLPILKIGDSDALEVGDLVLAIGNPFGVGQTTTSGIVSALARNHVGVSDFGFFIQTDAAINPGNSGGALVDMNGNLIGINTAIFTRSGGSNGIGFAIPGNLVAAVVSSALKGEDTFVRPWLGIQFEEVNAQTAEALGLDRPRGALVANVAPKSPALSAGFLPGDVILSMNGRAIEHLDALGYRLATQAINENVEFSVLRQEKNITLIAKLVSPPKNLSKPVQLAGKGPFAGAIVEELSPLLIQKMRLNPASKGVIVTKITHGSPAQRVGFLAGDIIVKLNGEVIKSSHQLEKLVQKNTNWWRFTIERNGQIINQVLRF